MLELLPSRWFAPLACALMVAGAVVACSTASTTALDASVPTSDASARDSATCEAPVLRKLDAQRGCLERNVLPAGLCYSTGIASKSSYAFCAASPSGEMFVSGVSGSSRYWGEGWTFGPQSFMDLKMPDGPRLSPENETRCYRGHALLEAAAYCDRPDAGQATRDAEAPFGDASGD
jgi:hypothetical protein